MHTFHKSLNQLLTLGVPECILTETRDMLMDTTGVHHIRLGGCERLGRIPLHHEVTITPATLPQEEFCYCFRESNTHEPLWTLVNMFVRVCGMLHAPQDGNHMDLCDDYNTLQGYRGHLVQLWSAYGSTLVAYESATDTFQRLLQERTQETLAHFQSASLQKELRVRTLPGRDSSPWEIVTLEGTGVQSNQDALIEAIILTHGGYQDTGTLLVLPGELADTISTWVEDTQRHSEIVHHRIILDERDTPAVLETLRALWSPSGGGDLADIRAAREAARRL